MRLLPVVFVVLLATPDRSAFLRAEAQKTSVVAQPAPRPTLAQDLQSLRLARLLIENTSKTAPSDADREALLFRHRDLVRRYPEDGDAHAGLAEILRSLSQNDEALLEYHRALELDPLRDDFVAAQADLFIQQGRVVEAADAFENAALLAPQNAAYPYALAHLYTLFRADLVNSRGLSPDALITRGTEYFHRAADLEPENNAYLQAYAEAFYTQPAADWVRARQAWEKLLLRSPQKDFVESHLVRVNLRLQDRPAALQHLAAISDPAFATLKVKLLKQIEKLPPVTK